MVHNGRIVEHEYETLKSKFEVSSDCDSEIILRILDSHKQRLDGLKDIFSHIHDIHMAVAVGERIEDKRHLWLFRNKYRPLWLVDLREVLGQIFFVSEPRIWDQAVNFGKLKSVRKLQKLIELPVNQVWFLDNLNNFRIWKVLKKNKQYFNVKEKKSN